MKQPHILCTPDDVAEVVLLPGDPERVLRVAAYLDDYREIAYNREFRTVTGNYKGMSVTVTSTGIGGASAVIALEELIACGAKKFIRIGSAGAAQSNIAIGDLIIATGAVREDGASAMYVDKQFPAAPSLALAETLKKIAIQEGFRYHTGLVRSHDAFYMDEELDLMRYWSGKNILGSDMETAALFVVGAIRGVEVASVLNNVVLYEGDLKEGINDYVDEGQLAEEGERREILLALETFKALL
ncbi:MAG: nucleoside phosphorylase [Clostridia bacterium]|nr:nucleoside phosphorylase [Clostridia bacterium]